MSCGLRSIVTRFCRVQCVNGSEKSSSSEGLPFAALGQNIFDAEWDEPTELFKPYEFFERGGVKVAVIIARIAPR